MPLDPLSALSVAASVIQVVDFAGNIISKGKDLYKSSDGALRENTEAETVTVRLREMTMKLKESQNDLQGSSANAPVGPQLSEPEELQLQEICKECLSISEQLLLHLSKLKVPMGQESRKWKSFQQALKTVRSKSDLDGLARRLGELRNELDTHLLVSLRGKATTIILCQDERFQKLNSDIQLIINTLLETRNAQSEELRARFETLTKSQHRELAETRAALVRLDGEKRRLRVELDILESLRFPQIHDRYDQIVRAHENTFTWIFRDPRAYQKPWDNFLQWIRNGTGIYWIQGKAASGKSTLMRFIWNHPLTTRNLQAWSVGCQLIVSPFFFWNSGIPEQRTQSGLIRSLLYEILNDHKVLVPEVFPEEWETKSALAALDRPINSETWSLVRLQKAFRRLIGLSSQHLRLCFFIDGLDEYEGEPEDIAQYFKDMSQCSVYAKFCMSSRPWPVFQDIYQESPGLKLQDLTYDDIKSYVSDKLENTDHMRRLSVIEPGSALLVEEIVQKAAGVFLWVTLVVKSLVSGLRNGDGILYLRRRLESLPSDLGNLYEHMLKSIEPLYREEASQIFQIFRTTGHKLDILTLDRALWFSDYRKAIDLKIPASRINASDAKSINLERILMKLNSRCKGLLEVTSFHVSYLHRTLWDYLELPLVWAELLSATKHTEFDPNTALLTSYVLEVKTTSIVVDMRSLYSAGNTMFRRVKALNLLASTRHMELIEELDRSINNCRTGETLSEVQRHWSNDNPRYSHASRDLHQRLHGDTLAMAVKFRLNWYIVAKAASTGSLPKKTPSGLPPLVFALEFDEWDAGKSVQLPDCPSVKELLTHGADPNETCEGFTVWQYVIHYLTIAYGISDVNIRKWLQLCQLMLQHGADPYACFPEGSTPSKPTLMLELRRASGELVKDFDQHVHRVESQEYFWQGYCVQDTPHRFCYSATSVIHNTFVKNGDENGDGKQLVRLLEEKKKAITLYPGKNGKARKRRKTKR